jgi:hypothetical protein
MQMHARTFSASQNLALLTAVFCITILVNSVLACGVERWAVKTLTDADVGRIIHTPRNSSIPELIALHNGTPFPHTFLNTHANSRIAPFEARIVILRALLLGYRLEHDEDFHLILADPDNTSRTLVAELPAPHCVGNSHFAQQLGVMRSYLVDHFGHPGPHTVRLTNPPLILIRGVIFFDFVHHPPQDGLAPNAVEMHPVLGLRIQ